jgi:GDP-L-fucose synthase
MAADVGGIMYNKKYPAQLITNNIQMGVNVFKAAVQKKVQKVVNIGTTCMYPANANVPFVESDLFTGYPAADTAPYAMAKLFLFEMAKAYKLEYGLRTNNLIPVNLYGPRDHYDGVGVHVVPALIHRILAAHLDNSGKVEVWGDGSATREFLFVGDAAEGIVSAALRCECADPINIGTGIETSILELVELLIDIIGYKGKIVWDDSKPVGTLRRVVDVQKAESIFDFKASKPLRDGLEETVSWMLADMHTNHR